MFLVYLVLTCLLPVVVKSEAVQWMSNCSTTACPHINGGLTSYFTIPGNNGASYKYAIFVPPSAASLDAQYIGNCYFLNITVNTTNPAVYTYVSPHWLTNPSNGQQTAAWTWTFHVYQNAPSDWIMVDSNGNDQPDNFLRFIYYDPSYPYWVVYHCVPYNNTCVEQWWVLGNSTTVPMGRPWITPLKNLGVDVDSKGIYNFNATCY